MWSYEHDAFTVYQIPALQDNYIYLIATDALLICVDPAEATPVMTACEGLGRPLTHILNTHHHADHTDGNVELKTCFGCTIMGAADDAGRIPGMDVQLEEGNLPLLKGLNIDVLSIPGHTRAHIAFVVRTGMNDALFCGDTLFGAGCGRLFEGTPEQMWQSLNKLMQLDDETRFYCAHEYTLNNLEFCLNKISQSAEIRDYYSWSENRRNNGFPTIPGSLGREKNSNPMLLPAQKEFCTTYATRHGITADTLTVFTHIRTLRNHW